MRPTACVALAGALVALGCTKNPEPEPSAPARSAAATAAATAPSPATAAPAAKPPADVAWDVPEAWKKVEHASPMRIATYSVPRAKGDAEDGELSISRAGGTVDVNVKRWASQFEPRSPEGAEREEKKVGELKVTLVQIKGTFTGSGMPGAPPAPPKPGYSLLGAIVEPPSAGGGAAPFFFKLTGPEKTIAEAKSDFDRLISSLRQK